MGRFFREKWPISDDPHQARGPNPQGDGVAATIAVHAASTLALIILSRAALFSAHSVSGTESMARYKLPLLVVAPLGLVIALVVGCAQESTAKVAADDSPAYEAQPQAGLAIATRHMLQSEMLPTGDALPNIDATTDRHIIYTADLNLQVKDFSRLREQIEQLVNQHNGFVANYGEEKISGSQLAGNWTVRVPVERFEAFLAAARELGVPESQHVHGQDMTEEYVDLEARLKTKRQLEERLTQIMQDRQADLNHLLQVEKELARVREEIERVEGRLRWLNDRVTLTTVTIRATERFDYQPPQVTLGDRVENSWSSSWFALGRTARFAMLSLVELIPWAMCLGLASLPAIYLLRQRRPKGIC